jgi:DNA-binding NtrC family response regulator
MRSRCFLVVGEGIGAYFPVTLEPLGKVLIARGLAEASRALVDERKALTGLFVDVVLADGSGFDVVERMRALEMEVPTLVVTPHLERQLGLDLNRALALDATILPAPVATHRLLTCVERWDKAAADDEAADELFLQNYAAETGMSLDEVKMNIEGILQKTGARTLAEAIRRFRRETFEREEYRRRTGTEFEDPSTRH